MSRQLVALLLLRACTSAQQLQCSPGGRGPACTADDDCTAYSGCLRCARRSKTCTDIPMPKLNPRKKPHSPHYRTDASKPITTKRQRVDTGDRPAPSYGPSVRTSASTAQYGAAVDPFGPLLRSLHTPAVRPSLHTSQSSGHLSRRELKPALHSLLETAHRPLGGQTGACTRPLLLAHSPLCCWLTLPFAAGSLSSVTE